MRNNDNKIAELGKVLSMVYWLKFSVPRSSAGAFAVARDLIIGPHCGEIRSQKHTDVCKILVTTYPEIAPSTENIFSGRKTACG